MAVLTISLGSLFSVGTQAVFTDTGTSTGNVFSTGSVNLKLTDNDETAQDNVSASATLTSMAPGDSVTAPLAVLNPNGTNGNSLASRYAVSSSVAAGSSILAQRLDLLVGRQAAAGGTCNGTATFGNPGSATGANWTLIYQGDLARSSSLNLVGNSNAGQDAAAAGQISGDRSLAGGGGAEYLCFRVTFRDAQDAGAAQAVAGEGGSSAHSYVQDDTTAGNDNAYQDLTATVTFTFNAEQV
jgi:hypothetical protein